VLLDVASHPTHRLAAWQGLRADHRRQFRRRSQRLLESRIALLRSCPPRVCLAFRCFGWHRSSPCSRVALSSHDPPPGHPQPKECCPAAGPPSTQTGSWWESMRRPCARRDQHTKVPSSVNVMCGRRPGGKSFNVDLTTRSGAVMCPACFARRTWPLALMEVRRSGPGHFFAFANSDASTLSGFSRPPVRPVRHHAIAALTS
jgi:hypothetical protein